MSAAVVSGIYACVLRWWYADPDYISHGLAHDTAADDCTHDVAHGLPHDLAADDCAY